MRGPLRNPLPPGYSGPPPTPPEDEKPKQPEEDLSLDDTLPLDLAIHPVLDEPTGAPDPAWYLGRDGRRIYMQTHFLWSLPFRALSRERSPPGN